MSPLVRAERGRRDGSADHRQREDDDRREAGHGTPAAPVAEADEEPVEAGTLFTATLIASRSPRPAHPIPEISTGWNPPDSQLHLRDRLV
jgi:hypothetical protein